MKRRVHGLGAAYALDALEEREQRRFERHLTRCTACAAEVRELRQDTVRLATAVAAEPPAALRGRVLAAARVTAQLPAEERATGRAAAPAPEPPEHAPVPMPVTVTSPGRAVWAMRLTAAGAALSLAAAVLLGVLWSRTADDLDRERAEAQAVEEVLAAPDAVVSSAGSGAQTGGINAVVSRDLRRAVVTVSGLPSPGEGRVYQLWAMHSQPGPIRPAGLLHASDPLVATGLGPSVHHLAVTEEPAGGSPQPTGQPLVRLDLDDA